MTIGLQTLFSKELRRLSLWSSQLLVSQAFVGSYAITEQVYSAIVALGREGFFIDLDLSSQAEVQSFIDSQKAIIFRAVVTALNDNLGFRNGII